MSKPSGVELLAQRLKELSDALAAEPASNLSPPRLKRLRLTIAEAYGKLRNVVENLDPIKHPGFVFEPSNPTIAGRIIGINRLTATRIPPVIPWHPDATRREGT